MDEILFDGTKIAEELSSLLKLKSTPISIIMINNVTELDSIPKLRYPTNNHTVCQILAQAIQAGFTIACTSDHCDSLNCNTIAGLAPMSECFERGEYFKGVWFQNGEDCAKHQRALNISGRTYAALVAAPIRSDRFQPDVCMLPLSPGQAFLLLSGLLRGGYRAITSDFVGESSCSQGWVKTLTTGEPALVTPCFAELRYAGYSDSEMLLSLTPRDLMTAVDGLRELSAVGLRYPIPSYSSQCDPTAGMNKSYPREG